MTDNDTFREGKIRMIFGGLEKNSLIDYPGKVSCVLFCSGCNFHCPYCHNPELVKMEGTGGSGPDVKKIDAFLQSRKGLLDGVVLSGGEPTIQKDIIFLCKKIRNMGYSIKLDTNGSRPQVLKRLISEGLVDYIAMDIKTDPDHYSPLIKDNLNPRHILTSISTIMESDLAYEFRTTCVKPFVDPNIIEKISKIINGAMLYVLQRFYKNRVLRPELFSNDEYYGQKDLIHLKSIAESHVDNCLVRNLLVN